MRRPKFDSLSGRRVFVTGAASGIGAAVARQAARDGAVLFLTDRNAAGLAAVADDITANGGTVALAEPADVSDYADVQALAEKAHATGPMDVVMNVAGIAAWGTVDRLEHRQWRAMVDVNLMGPIHVIECFVPPMMAARRGGHLVNVSSAAGLIALPWHAAYSASKFGLRGVSEVLRFDLRPHGIGVSVVCPGGVDTPLTESVEVAGVDQGSPRWAKLRSHFRGRAVSPDFAAAAILHAVKRNKYLVYTSRDIQLLYLLQRVAPHMYAVVERVMGFVMRRAMPVTDVRRAA